MQATFNNRILIFSCNFISMNISGFLISSPLERDLTFSLSEDLTFNDTTSQERESSRFLVRVQRERVSTLCVHLPMHMDMQPSLPHLATQDKIVFVNLVTKLNNFQLHTHSVTGKNCLPHVPY